MCARFSFTNLDASKAVMRRLQPWESVTQSGQQDCDVWKKGKGVC
jgi:hypothetical protein